MAQIVKLRRSSVSGQKPTNTNLQLGELAQNTTDGKIFLAKSGSGGPSIEELIVTNTSNTGSINLLGSVSASNFTGSFIGDGALLYNIPASGVTGLQLDRITSGNVSASISPSTGLVINTGVTITGSISATEFTGSGLGLTNVPFHVSGSDVNGGTYNKQFTKLQFDDSTGLNVSESVAGTAFISIGSHFRDIFVSGSNMLRATGSDAFEIIPEGGIEVTTSITDTNSNGYVKELRLSTTTLSSSLDTRIYNLSSSVVYQSQTSSMTVLSSSYALTASFALNAGAGAEGRTYIHTQSSASTTWTVTHNLGEKYPAIVVFDSSDNVIVPGTITAINDTSFTVTFPSAQTGKVSATVGGGLPFVSASFVDYVLAVNNDVPYWKGGVISGSAQIILTGTTGYSTLSSSIATVSSSLDSRLDVLETYSGSQQVPTASFSFRTAETSVYCKNTAGYQINKGQVVRIVGSVGDNPLIATASYTNESNSANTLGIATENIPNDSFGMVITEGVLLGVNTLGTTGGQLLYLGANGNFTTTEPIAPNHGVRLGEVLRVQQNNGSIYVRVDNGMELGEGHDVLFSGTSAGDLIVRNSSNIWVNTKQLTGSYHITGSLNATSLTGSIDYNNLTNVPTLISGSSQVIITGTTGYSTFSSSIATTTLNIKNRVDSIESKTGSYATTGSNLFIGTQTLSGSIIPSVDNLYDLGSSTHQWRDVYISSGSLYIDGTKVISSTTQELQITTDTGQSIKILEGGTDSIILQTADGDVELKSSGDGDILLDPTNGKILLKGTVEVLSGNKIQSSVGGTPVVFANDIVVSGSIELTGTIDGIDLTSFSSSANTRLTNLESSGGSLNSFTASANTRLGALETESGSVRTAFNSYTSSANGRLSSIETSTGSLNTFSSSTSLRLTSLETESGSIRTDLNSYTSSANGRLTSIEVSTGSLNSFTSSTAGSLIAIQTSTASLNSFSSSTNTRVGALETESGSIRTAFNSYTSSNDSTNTTQNNRLTSLETSTSSLNTFSSSTNTRVGVLETESGSIRTAFNSYTSSNDGTNTTQNNRLTALETSTSSLNSFTSSTISKLTSIETSTGSLNTFSSSTNTRVGALETESGSIRTAFNSYTSSNDGTNTTQNGRLTSLEGKTGSYATTGSNVFIGNQTITGSLYISENLVVAGSSSISFISQSTLNIGTNLITVNAQNPGTRFGGLAVIDSGSSPLVSGSILFDSVNDQWIFVHQAIAGSPTTSSVVLMGPESFNSLGSEIYPTTNRIVKSINSEHLGDSNISDTGTKVSINSNTEITGTFVVTGTALVSGSSQINHNTTTNYVANEHINHTSVSISAGNGLSGGGDISSTRTITLDTGSAHFTGGVKSKMNTDGVISGSAQVIAALPSGTVSGSSQVSFNGITDKPTLVSGSSQVSFSGLSGVPSGLVSGSSQVSYTGLSNIPSGIVSGSSQISFGSISGVPSGLVSGSSQISFGSISGVPSGLVSGSSQISFGSISGIPSGLVSGSSQISIASTSGFGTYLNQAVLTTSSPTFGGLTIGTSAADSNFPFYVSTVNTTGKYTLTNPGLGFNLSDNYAQLQLYGTAGAYIDFTTTSSDYQGRIMYTGGAFSVTGNMSWGGATLSSAVWQGSSISTTYTDAKVTSVNAGTGISVNATTGAVTVTNTITNNNQLTNGAGYITSYTETDTLSSVTARGASTSTALTLSGKVTFSSTVASRPQFPGGILGLDTGDGNFDIWGISRDYYPSHGTAANAWGLRWNGDNNDFEFVGGGTNRVILDMDGGNITSTGTVTASTFSGTIAGSNVSGNISGNAANITSYTINQSVGTSNSPTFVDTTLTGGLTVGGSLTRGTFTAASNYVIGADNIVLKGNSSGVSGIFFESEKDGTNINHPSDFGFIQFHSYGIGGSSGEANRLIIGASNDADDLIVLNPMDSNGVKVRVGAGTTEYTVYHAGNIPTWNQNTTGTASNITSYTINQSVGTGNSPTFAGVTITGNSTLGDGNGDTTRINDILYLGASDSGDAHFYFGEDSSGWYGSYWYWDSGYNHYWYSRNAGTNTLLMYHDTRETTNVYFQRHILPTSNNAYNLGSASLGWANVYTNDLHLSNMNKPEGNDIDGTNGNWTIQEGAENLYIINNNNGKKFKISLEEI